MEKKKLTVPFVAGLDRATDIESFSAMLTNAVEETQTGSAQIDTVNWPEDFRTSHSARSMWAGARKV